MSALPPPGAPAPAGADDHVEVEWQFDALDLRPVDRWLAALPERAPSPGRPSLSALARPARRLIDRYLDTDDWRIGRAGFVLRTRRRAGREEATLKDTRPADPGGLRQRLEVTESLPAGGIEALGPEGPVGWRLAAVVGRRPLRQVVEVRTRRRPYGLRMGETEVGEMAVDETSIAVGPHQRPVQLRRVEVEVDPAWVAGLAPWVQELQATCGLQAATLSKFEAGLLALGLSVPGPPELGPTAAGSDGTFAELAYAVVRRQLGVLLAKEPGTRLGEDIEELHDMRVATRRLRAALDLFADALPVRTSALRDELRWLAGSLGAVRDLDVQLERMDEPEWQVVGGPNASPLDELRRLLTEEHGRARAQLLDDLDSPRYERLVAGLVALAQRGPVRRTAAARLPAVLAVPELVDARHRAVVRAARRARRSGLPTDYHRLRIRAKRLRYSLEFTAPLYEGKTERFVRQLARLQDALGLMQDAEVASARLLALATDAGSTLSAETVFAMGAVAERYRTEGAALLARMGRGLKVLRGPEWQELGAHMERRRTEAEAHLPARSPRRHTPGAALASTGEPAAAESPPPAVPTSMDNGHPAEPELVNGPGPAGS